MSCRAPALVALAFALPLGAAAEQAITCPAGAALIQMSNARGREQWCERPGPSPVAHGPYLLFYANDTVRVLNRDSVPDGDWRSFHPDGTPSGEVTFVAGKPTGMLLGWYQNGKASFVGGFRDGVAIGVFEIFDAEGRLRMSVDYGADGSGRRRSAWDATSQAIDPGSAEALAVRERALDSSPLIFKALMSSSAMR